jgi:hypothetical protein
MPTLLSRIVVAFVFHAGATLSTTDIHVSPSGSDTAGDGSASWPFATLVRGQTEARKALADVASGGGDVTVHVGPGRYYQSEPLTFTSADSGWGGRRMRYVGPGPAAGIDPTTAAVVHGGVGITGWKRAASGGPIWSADVAALAPNGIAQWRFYNLIEGQRGAILARHPDFGSGYLKDFGCHNNATQLTCPAGVLPEGLTPTDMSVFANVGGNWFTAVRQISRVQ